MAERVLATTADWLTRLAERIEYHKIAKRSRANLTRDAKNALAG